MLSMIFRFKAYLRRRQIARLDAQLARVRALRVALQQEEFALRGELADLEADL